MVDVIGLLYQEISYKGTCYKSDAVYFIATSGRHI